MCWLTSQGSTGYGVTGKEAAYKATHAANAEHQLVTFLRQQGFSFELSNHSHNSAPRPQQLGKDLCKTILYTPGCQHCTRQGRAPYISCCQPRFQHLSFIFPTHNFW